jgi:hypothetical protein
MEIKSFLFLFFCFSLVSSEEGRKEITAENIDDLEILKNKIKENNTFVVFHAEWCRHW